MYPEWVLRVFFDPVSNFLLYLPFSVDLPSFPPPFHPSLSQLLPFIRNHLSFCILGRCFTLRFQVIILSSPVGILKIAPFSTPTPQPGFTFFFWPHLFPLFDRRGSQKSNPSNLKHHNPIWFFDIIISYLLPPLPNLVTFPSCNLFFPFPAFFKFAKPSRPSIFIPPFLFFSLVLIIWILQNSIIPFSLRILTPYELRFKVSPFFPPSSCESLLTLINPEYIPFAAFPPLSPKPCSMPLYLRHQTILRFICPFLGCYPS